MGNICNTSNDANNPRETVDTLVRVRICGVTVEFIYGNYRQIRCDCLVNIIQDLNIKNNTVLSQSTQNPKQVLANIQYSRKRSFISDAERGLPFKKILNCLLPLYSSIEQKEYITLVQNLLRDVFTHKCKQYLMVFSQTGEFNTLPNQLIVAQVFQILLEFEGKKPIVEKLRLVSMDKNMCNLFKLQLSKFYSLHKAQLEFERIKLYEIENQILY